MKTITSQAKIIVLALALALGISYVSAAGTWTGPTATPPSGNVDTPVNVGDNAQSKAGDLAVGAFLANFDSMFLGKVTIADGTQGAGKVLVSDANGVASWEAASTASLSGTVGGGCNSAGVTWGNATMVSSSCTCPASYTIRSIGGASPSGMCVRN